jgi:UDP:flavonoid glycosyltransferase YjiC (YdhE family)
MTRGRFLLVTWAGGGNVPPLLALAVALQTAGYDIRVLGPEGLRARFAAAGIAFNAHRSHEEWKGGAPVMFPSDDEQRMAFLRGLAADVTAELERAPVDVAVVDYMQPDAMCAVERAGTPLVAFVHTLYWRVARTETSPIHMSGSVDDINRLRADIDLPALEALPDLLRAAACVLVVTTKDLDAPDGPVAGNVRYVGPLLEDAGNASWTSPWDNDPTPLVHVCTSTVVPPHMAAPVLQRVLDATADLPVHVFVTAADDTRAELRISENAVASPYVHHGVLLPHVDLFVNHGGLGSVSAGLAAGVPMVCMPLFAEQPENAEHAQRLGVAREVASDAPVDAIRACIVEALADDGMRQRAANVAAEIGDTISVAVREVTSAIPSRDASLNLDMRG